MRSERRDSHAGVATAQLGVGGDGDPPGGLGDVLPLAARVLNVGEQPFLGGGLASDGPPAAGEISVPSRRPLRRRAARVSCSARMALTWASRPAMRTILRSAATCGGAQAVSRS